MQRSYEFSNVEEWTIIGCKNWSELKILMKISLMYYNPLVPSAHKSVRISKISILKLEGIIKKISYERRDYESVDENSLSEAMSRKNYEKKNSGTKGLRRPYNIPGAEPDANNPLKTSEGMPMQYHSKSQFRPIFCSL